MLGERDGGGFTGHYARAFFTPDDDGTYRVAVGAGRQNRGGLGCYTISVRADDHPDDYRIKPGSILKPGRSISGSIDSDVAPNSAKLNTWDWQTKSGIWKLPRQGIESMDDRDVVRINITEAGDYDVTVTNKPSGVGIWAIRDKKGNDLTPLARAPVASLSLHLEKGHYYVEIGTPYSSSGNTGTYTLSLDSS